LTPSQVRYQAAPQPVAAGDEHRQLDESIVIGRPARALRVLLANR
jgi:hypothetical protein